MDQKHDVQNVSEQNRDAMEDIISSRVRDGDRSKPGGGMGD